MIKTKFKRKIKNNVLSLDPKKHDFFGDPAKALPEGDLRSLRGRPRLSQRAPLYHLGEPWTPSILKIYQTNGVNNNFFTL